MTEQTGQRVPPGQSDIPVIPGYSRLELVSRGSTAQVYRAIQDRLNRPVAIKLLRVDDGLTTAEQVETELATTVALSAQPHIVSIIDTGSTSIGRPYIVMEYCEGGSYGHILARGGPLPVSEVVDVGVKVGEALQAAHEVGIIHRDVKPHNVLRSKYGPALTDFGIARAANDLSGTITLHKLTPQHASPEALRREPQGPASDVYSLASTMWNLLTGYPPFADPGDNSPDPFEYRDRALRDPLPPMPRPDVPPWLYAELLRAMAKTPAERHASAGEFAGALRRGWLRSSGELSTPGDAAPARNGETPHAPAGPAAGPGTAGPATAGPAAGVPGVAGAAGGVGPARHSGPELDSPFPPSPFDAAPGGQLPPVDPFAPMEANPFGATAPADPRTGSPAPGWPTPGAPAGWSATPPADPRNAAPAPVSVPPGPVAAPVPAPSGPVAEPPAPAGTQPDQPRRRIGIWPFVAAAVVGILIGVGALVVLRLGDNKKTPPPQAASPTAPTSAPAAGQDAKLKPTGVKLADHGTWVQLSWTDRTNGNALYLVTGGVAGTTPTKLAQPAHATTARIDALRADADYCFVVIGMTDVDHVSPGDRVCTHRTGSASPR
ncbi:serine/threonine-protein kinase [Actinocatenispora comari]|uniref:serine/threonine-protein kinase n=2 Tax=Actinocatenispora comari TaxID=2807577 RepID=UPI001A931683|nr:serine/threonine-protein kinase [Actinocatenispora comari]